MTCKFKQCPSSDDRQHCYHALDFNGSGSNIYRCCNCGRIEYINSVLPWLPNGTTITPIPYWQYIPSITYYAGTPVSSTCGCARQ